MRGVDARNTGIYRGTQQSGLEESTEPASLRINSNPVTGSAVFSVSDGVSSPVVKVFDITGKLVTEITSCWTPGADIQNGVYFARLEGMNVPPVKFLLAR
jgi:hypothetical protein